MSLSSGMSPAGLPAHGAPVMIRRLPCRCAASGRLLLLIGNHGLRPIDLEPLATVAADGGSLDHRRDKLAAMTMRTNFAKHGVCLRGGGLDDSIRARHVMLGICTTETSRTWIPPVQAAAAAAEATSARQRSALARSTTSRRGPTDRKTPPLHRWPICSSAVAVSLIIWGRSSGHRRQDWDYWQRERPVTFELVVSLVPVLRRRGYRFVRLDAIPQVQAAMGTGAGDSGP